MGIAVSDQEIEKDHPDEAKPTIRRKMDFQQTVHAVFDPRSTVLLIFELGRDVQQLAEILLMQPHGDAIDRFAIEAGHGVEGFAVQRQKIARGCRESAPLRQIF